MGQQTYQVMEQQQSFAQFVWNSQTNEFLGRNGTSWGKIFVFYCIFYTFLAGFMSLTMFVLYQTLDRELPTYNPGDGSSILKNPALGIRPLPPSDRIESSLIWFDLSNNKTYEHYVKSLNEFVQPYVNETRKTVYNYTDCSKKAPLSNQVCNVEPAKLGPDCNVKSQWGYPVGSPCVLLKLNKMIFWEPDLYQSESDFKNRDVSESAKKVMNSNIKGGKFDKVIWVTCEGENQSDKEYLKSVDYYPQQGFPSYYYPYSNQGGYMPPIVAVQFSNVKRNVLINIECKVWAKNIKHVRKTKLGIAHFEILVDEK